MTWKRVRSGWYRASIVDGELYAHVIQWGNEWSLYVTEDAYTVQRHEVRSSGFPTASEAKATAASLYPQEVAQ